MPGLHLLLDLPDAAAEGGRVLAVAERVAPLEQPRAQLPLLRPGQLDDLLGIVGAALDQRQRLQHRIVHVGGHVGPFFGPGPGLPFEHEVAGDAQPPRARSCTTIAVVTKHEPGQWLQQGDALMRRQQPAEPGPQQHDRRDEPPPQAAPHALAATDAFQRLD